MWQDYCAHHIQRGDVTAVVWGAPGAEGQSSGPGRGPAGDAGDACPDSSRYTAPAAAAAAAAAAGAGAAVVDAESLTRGRRSENPFVQQCDLVFPLPDGESPAGGARALEEQEEAERRAEAFVVRTLGEAFYYRARGPLSALVREPFLSSCVLNGGFSALALNAPSDQGNSFAILPGGVLVISLDRESFQTLGLPGEAAPTRPKGKSKRAGAGAGSTGGSVGVLGGGAGGTDRYVSAFDLSSKAFRPGKPLHDRVLSCLCGAPGSGVDDEQGVAADVVVCSWAEAGVDGGDLQAGGETAAGGRRKSGLSEQEVNSGSEEAAAAGAESTLAGNNGSASRKGWHGEGGRSDKQQKQRERKREREQWCREVTFPPGFSAQRVDLTPETRFFREACCPDLDFVRQGFAATTTNTTTTAADADLESGVQRTARASHPPPTLPPLPGPTKCRLVLDLFEWLGAVSCGLDAAVARDPSPPEPYLSEFETPRHLRYRRNRVVCRARLRGFLPPLAVARFVKAAASAAAASPTDIYDAKAGEELGQSLSSSASETGRLGRPQPDGSSWGSVTAWPFRDAPRAYPGADAPCAGEQRTKRSGGVGCRGRKDGSGGGRGEKGVAERSAKEWPVGGHGVYAVVACPGQTAVAYVSARCPGPGW
eukprot:g14362.t1